MESGVVITIVDADGETSATLHNGATEKKAQTVNLHIKLR